jgi:hypothetical protein
MNRAFVRQGFDCGFIPSEAAERRGPDGTAVRPRKGILIKAGIRTVGLLSGGFPEESLREAGAVAVYRDVSDLLDNYDESPLAKGRTDAAGGRS